MKKKSVFSCAIVASTLLLGACSTHVSRGISAEGMADEVVFPDISRAYEKDGTFPRLDDVRLAQVGMNKGQLYELLGAPHFAEGFYRVREWDYLFHFRTDAGVKTCQFKILFNRDYISSSQHWQPADCADLLKEPAAVAAVVAPAAPAAAPRTLIEADGLFTFARAGIEDLSAEGQQRLQRLATELKSNPNLRSVDVLAYTDEIGSPQQNVVLAQRRAESVRSYLLKQGVPAGMVRALGMGSVDPVVQCDSRTSREVRIRCLAPNRRVEVRAYTN
ncbi:MAG: OmpA family protein [Pseudomonadota bacterium]|nr:OmpA family protein [Pseudomonadota bacterium]